MADESPTLLDTADGDPLRGWIGQMVVLDTQGPMIFIGRLTEVRGGHLVLMEADVHDSSESRSTKDLYLLETRDLGVKVNRARVVVDRRTIISASLLADVRS